MTAVAKGVGVLMTLLVLFLIWADRPASAISEEIAKKCRAMAVKAHPTARAGTRTGAAKAQQEYFKDCVAKEEKAAK